MIRNEILINEGMTPEQKLWGAVIERAFLDVFSEENFWKKFHPQERNVYQYNWNQACAWFSLSNKDFIMTCQYAGVDPEWVMRLYHRRKSVEARTPIR